MLEAEEFALTEEANLRNYASQPTGLNAPNPPSWPPQPSNANLIQEYPNITSTSFSSNQRKYINGHTTNESPPPITTSRNGTRRAQDNNDGNSERKCQACGKVGHTSRYCRTKQRNCFSCGKEGHFSNACPMLLCGVCKQAGHRPLNCPLGFSTKAAGNGQTPTARSGEN
ncbi:hypothetical protein J437_LFUL017914 [Ladona fulva]|uniref:CCHC-type domain-containing protein n=1 Tax=Ladona fulva TaxID=123851 RepID=A0A8K0KPH7_LADFU|nr:hypothetical protein J437_LFUL017914 [Ladona fulva]